MTGTQTDPSPACGGGGVGDEPRTDSGAGRCARPAPTQPPPQAGEESVGCSTGHLCRPKLTMNLVFFLATTAENCCIGSCRSPSEYGGTEPADRFWRRSDQSA